MDNKTTIIAAAIAAIILPPLATADQFRITNGHPDCTECNGHTPEGERGDPDLIGTFLDTETGEFTQNDNVLGNLNFATIDSVVNNTTGITNNRNNINRNRSFIEQLFVNNATENQSLISSQFATLENKFNNQMAVNSAIQFMSPTDSGKTKVNIGAASINTDAQALGLAVVGTYYAGVGLPKFSYGAGLGANVGNGTFAEKIFKGHFGFEF